MTTELERPPLRNRPIMPARMLPSPPNEPHLQRLEVARAAAAEPYRGITTNGRAIHGLFPIESSGVSVEPIREALVQFAAALQAEQRAEAHFPLDSETWRQWSNIHPFLMRHGVCLDDLTPEQRDRGLALLRSGLSERGYQTARDVMRLNYTIGEITGRMGIEYGEWLYRLSLFGQPSAIDPWGWQLDGHHLIVNCLVLGDQVVLTPLFMGSEPVFADSGLYAGTRVFEVEEREGLAFMQSLDREQRNAATIGEVLPVELFAAGFKDNAVLPESGLRYEQLDPRQRERLVELIDVYVGRTRPGHAAVKLAEVKRHLGATRFSWMGGCEQDSVFYYRIQSPVILIEFDHQRGIAFAYDEPTRTHIHTVVRTPNGNDYGKDLLRQHYAQHDHAHPQPA
jgi:hypothetical protein